MPVIPLVPYAVPQNCLSFDGFLPTEHILMLAQWCFGAHKPGSLVEVHVFQVTLPGDRIECQEPRAFALSQPLGYLLFMDAIRPQWVAVGAQESGGGAKASKIIHHVHQPAIK